MIGTDPSCSVSELRTQGDVWGERRARVGCSTLNSTMNPRNALLLSGGIGDYLHYIVRFSSFIERQATRWPQLNVFVESTNPSQVETLFQTCLPEVNCRFVPSALHWTKTNPLLDVNRSYDRMNRPAYQYVLSQGFDSIEDWFLPFLCTQYGWDSSRIEFLKEQEGAESERPLVFVSLRNKGFVWWPACEAFSLLRKHIPSEFDLRYVGTADEKFPGLEILTAESVLEALRLSCRSRLFVGTDTGFATARELVGLPNIYCLNEYWYRELMVRYGYWTDGMKRFSLSRFAFNAGELETALADVLSNLSMSGNIGSTCR